MSAQGGSGPELTRVGGGRSARVAALVAVAVVALAVAVAIAERSPAPSTSPLPSIGSATATATGSPSVAVQTPAVSPTSGIGSFPISEPYLSFGFFSMRLVSQGSWSEVLVGPSIGAVEESLPFPPTLWRERVLLELRWHRDDVVEVVARQAVSLGSSNDIGLPAELGSGTLFLRHAPPGAPAYWRYEIVLDRASTFSDPDELVITARLEAFDAVRVPIKPWPE